MNKSNFLLCFWFVFSIILLKCAGKIINPNAAEPIPIVMWHGMGDSCCNPLSLGKVKSALENDLPGIYVLSIKTDDSMARDIMDGFFMNVNTQVTKVCDELAKDSKLTGGYNAIGFSQGSQFLRAVAQRCPNPPMKNLISVGGQHQGIYGFKCVFSVFICEAIYHLLDYGAYQPSVQNSFVQAEYWHDPLNETEYKAKSVFLADINNERTINETYRENLKKLQNFVMVKFLKDTMVVPKESEWFGYYEPGQTERMLEMNETELYQEDKIGLKWMNEQGKLKFLQLDSDHLRFTWEWFQENIIEPYLKN